MDQSANHSPSRARPLAPFIWGTLAAACAALFWIGAQRATLDNCMWSGPRDADLVKEHPDLAWMWAHDPYALAPLIIALIGFTVVRTSPKPDPYRVHLRLWIAALFLICLFYAFSAEHLMVRSGNDD